MGLILPSGVSEPEDADLYHKAGDKFGHIELAFKQYFCLINDDLKAEEVHSNSQFDMSAVTKSVGGFL